MPSFSVVTVTDAPIRHWPIIGPPIVGAQQSADTNVLIGQYRLSAKRPMANYWCISSYCECISLSRSVY